MILLNEITAWEHYYTNHEVVTAEDCNYQYNNYIQFIKQPLHPSQFIPWDMENDCPMEKPDVMDKEFDNDTDDLVWDDSGADRYVEAVDKYEQAEERVLFEGFEHIDTNEFNTLVRNGAFELTIPSYHFPTIKDLFKKVYLTDKVAKQLKLI